MLIPAGGSTSSPSCRADRCGRSSPAIYRRRSDRSSFRWTASRPAACRREPIDRSYGGEMTHLPGKPRRAEVSVVVPLYNEEQNVPELYRRLTASLAALRVGYELVFVNDGSADRTAKMIASLSRRDPRLTAINLSRNFGHQAAICCGIDHARG